MAHTPIRNVHGISENVRNLFAKTLRTIQSQVPEKKEPVVPNRMKLKDAEASGLFTYIQYGLYKKADSDAELGRVWEVKDIDGEKWLVAYQDDEDDIIYSIANEQLQTMQKTTTRGPRFQIGDRVKLPLARRFPSGSEGIILSSDPITMGDIAGSWVYEVKVISTNEIEEVDELALAHANLSTTAAKVKPEDIPINQDIKSKNITIDETGGQGTAKVTIEFTDADKGYEFYNQQGSSTAPEEAPKEEAPAEEAPAEGEEPAQKQAPAPQPAQGANPFAELENSMPTFEGAGAPAPQAGLKSTVKTISKKGEQSVTVIREVISNVDGLRMANYRDSQDPSANCGVCTHFASFGDAGPHAGQCGLFNTRVIPSAICDEFTLHSEEPKLTGDTLLASQKTAELPLRGPQKEIPLPKGNRSEKNLPKDTDVFNQKLPTGLEWSDTTPEDPFDDSRLNPQERARRRKQLDHDRALDEAGRNPDSGTVLDDAGLFEGDDDDIVSSMKTAEVDPDVLNRLQNAPPGGHNWTHEERDMEFQDPDFMEYSAGYNYGYFKARGSLKPEDVQMYLDYQRSDLFDIAAQDGERDYQQGITNRYSSRATSVRYYFINEAGKRVDLNWKENLRIGAQFERPDTGTIVRLGGYDTVHYVNDEDIVAALTRSAAAGDPLDDFVAWLQQGLGAGYRTLNSGGGLEPYTQNPTAFIVGESTENGRKFKITVTEATEEDLTDEDIVAALTRSAAEIGGDDAIPPMSFENTDTGSPEDTQPLPPNQNLQNGEQTLNPNDPSNSNVLYDSQNDRGPQFQTLVNPKDKSVTVKFLDSPEEEALNQAINGPDQGPLATPPGQGPQQQTTINSQEEFGDQEIPTGF